MVRCHVLYVLLAFSLASGCGSAAPAGPAETVEEFYRLINEGDCGEATAMMGGEFVTGGTAAEICDAVVQGVSARGGLVGVEILRELVRGDTARVAVWLAFGDAGSHEWGHDLAMMDGAWRITSVD
ncbi:MAG: hypothetical protein F4Z65_07680 [Acidobacteria bacterium]|nr:hypothetical protein [Acidobacteriota bacterium]MYA44995.1 hypothetical protein [Acidobacteriota bacterium]MYI38572.1 hypothetical protein [Acidobacteriota bacterium]